MSQLTASQRPTRAWPRLDSARCRPCSPLAPAHNDDDDHHHPAPVATSQDHCCIETSPLFRDIDPDDGSSGPPYALVTDLSTNGTYLNQARLKRKTQVRAYHGDRLAFFAPQKKKTRGKAVVYTLFLTNDPSAPPPPLRPATASAAARRRRGTGSGSGSGSGSAGSSTANGSIKTTKTKADAERGAKAKRDEAYNTATRLKKELDGE